MNRQQEETRWTLLMSKWCIRVHRERLRKRQRQEVESHNKKPEDEFHKIKQEAFKLKKQNHAPPLFCLLFPVSIKHENQQICKHKLFQWHYTDTPLLHTHLFHIVYHAGSHSFAHYSSLGHTPGFFPQRLRSYLCSPLMLSLPHAPHTFPLISAGRGNAGASVLCHGCCGD